MIIVHVHIHVKSEIMEDFIRLTTENARNSIREAGIQRFDLIQQQDDPTQFMLVEVYKDDDAIVAHKNTAHYAKWKNGVEAMLAEPRFSIKYAKIFPEDKDY